MTPPPPPWCVLAATSLGVHVMFAMLCLYTALCLYFLALYVRVTIIISQIYCLFRLVVPEPRTDEINTCISHVVLDGQLGGRRGHISTALDFFIQIAPS
jgi:hypothetical protein